MTKEINAREARNLSSGQIPDTFMDSIFEQITCAANKGALSVVINLEGYCDHIFCGLLEVEPSVVLLANRLQALGYRSIIKPAIDTIHPDIESWIEIKW